MAECCLRECPLPSYFWMRDGRQLPVASRQCFDFDERSRQSRYGERRIGLLVLAVRESPMSPKSRINIASRPSGSPSLLPEARCLGGIMPCKRPPTVRGKVSVRVDTSVACFYVRNIAPASSPTRLLRLHDSMRVGALALTPRAVGQKRKVAPTWLVLLDDHGLRTVDGDQAETVLLRVSVWCFRYP